MHLQRWAPLTGILGPIAVVVGLFTMNAPDASQGDGLIDQWFATHGYLHWLLSAISVAFGGILILIFAAILTARQCAFGAGRTGRYLTLIAATSWGLLTLIGGAIYASVPSTLLFMGPQPPTADTYRYLGGLFYGVLVMFCALTAALLAATLSLTSLFAHDAGILPRWLAWIGLPATVLMLANALLPMTVITAWFAAVSITLIARWTPAERESVDQLAPASAVLLKV